MTFRNPKPVHNYIAYGLALISNRPISALTVSSSLGRSPDVEINLGSLPNRNSGNNERKIRYESSCLNHTGQPDLQIWDVDNGKFLRMVYADGVEFWLDQDCSTLWANWPASSSIEDTISYLVGPVLGLVLRLRGFVCLHASSVSINGRAIVFVGPEGAGKSTTAAVFAREGFPLVSDDIVALVETGRAFQVFPAYPRVNLWSDSVKLLYGSADALPRILPEWDKRCLKVGEAEGTKFEERPLPLGAIYILGNDTAEAEPHVETISQKTALLLLVANTYATNFLDAKQRAEEFAVLSRVVSGVPLRKINRRRGQISPEELCAVIRQDLADIDSPSAP